MEIRKMNRSNFKEFVFKKASTLQDMARRGMLTDDEIELLELAGLTIDMSSEKSPSKR